MARAATDALDQLSISLDEVIKEKIQNHVDAALDDINLDDAVETAIDNKSSYIRDSIESELNDYNIKDALEAAVGEADIDGTVQAAIDDCGIEQRVEAAIEARLPGLVKASLLSLLADPDVLAALTGHLFGEPNN